MSLEEKFKALMKNFEAISSTAEELKQKLQQSKGQKAYLRKQLSESMKMKEKIDPKSNRIKSRRRKSGQNPSKTILK